MITGSILAALGSALALWVLFNLFVALQPEASRTSPAPAIFLSSALIAVGISRMTGGRWSEWALWRNQKTYWVATLGLLALVAAYVYNMLLRLQSGFRSPVEYVSLVADAAFLFMCGRIFKWLLAGWRSAGDGADEM